MVGVVTVGVVVVVGLGGCKGFPQEVLGSHVTASDLERLMSEDSESPRKCGELKTWIATLMAHGPPVGLAKGLWVTPGVSTGSTAPEHLWCPPHLSYHLLLLLLAFPSSK